MLFLFSLDLDINYMCNLLRMHKWWCILHIERYIYVYVCKMSRHWYIRRYIRTKIMSSCCMHLRTYLKLHICVLYIWMPKLCINTVFKVLFNSLNSLDIQTHYSNDRTTENWFLKTRCVRWLWSWQWHTLYSVKTFIKQTFILIWAVLRMF